jgi:hypothetical protein
MSTLILLVCIVEEWEQPKAWVGCWFVPPLSYPCHPWDPTHSLPPSLPGKDMPLQLQGASASSETTAVLRLEKSEQEWTFINVSAEPVPSLLRGFSAPVKLSVEGQGDEQLLFLFANDSDPFNR